jgi:Holliday junction resolvase
MELALNYLRSIPWRNIRDTSASKPYDYVADSPNGRIYIEVKGTTSSGESINLTKNEVAHFTEHAPNTALVLISNIKLIGLRPVTNSGSLTFICPWNINSDDLTAVQYRYEITPASRRRKPVRR